MTVVRRWTRARLWSASASLGIVAVVFGLSIAVPNAIVARDEAERLDLPAVGVTEIADGVWIHTTYADLPKWGMVGANGLIVETETGSLLIDTGWTDADATSLANYGEHEFGPVQAVIVTHAHDDRMGGLAELQRRGIPSYGSEAAARIAPEKGLEPPTHTFDGHMPLEQFGIDGEVFYAGAGHSVDNVVVWFAESKVLFGGCMIRAASTTSAGNIADADLDAWPVSIKTLRDRYPDVQWVVPGHGDPYPGDALLIHTQQLLRSR